MQNRWVQALIGLCISSFLTFFAIENIANGVRVSSTSPNDGNNYTSGLISEVFFDDLFLVLNGVKITKKRF